jgi:hypothetical protein
VTTCAQRLRLDRALNDERAFHTFVARLSHDRDLGSISRLPYNRAIKPAARTSTRLNLEGVVVDFAC